MFNCLHNDMHRAKARTSICMYAHETGHSRSKEMSVCVSPNFRARIKEYTDMYKSLGFIFVTDMQQLTMSERMSIY